MTNERDPLELLRAAWRAEQTEPSETLDPETRATVRYLRDVLAAQTPAPPPALLQRLERRRNRRRRLRLMRYGSALAAAAALVVWLRVGAGSDPGITKPPSTLPTPPTTAAPAAASIEGVVWRASSGDYRPRHDGVELRSGAVRLILLTSPVPPSVPRPNETSSS